MTKNKLDYANALNIKIEKYSEILNAYKDEMSITLEVGSEESRIKDSFHHPNPLCIVIIEAINKYRDQLQEEFENI